MFLRHCIVVECYWLLLTTVAFSVWYLMIKLTHVFTQSVWCDLLHFIAHWHSSLYKNICFLTFVFFQVFICSIPTLLSDSLCIKCRHFVLVAPSHCSWVREPAIVIVRCRCLVYAGNPRGLLLATDVAARGLDIPDVQHVIHYQAPRTTEVVRYCHSCHFAGVFIADKYMIA